MVDLLLKNDHIRLSVPSGTAMRDAALKSGASMVFGCRVGDCTTCAARVESGMEHLSPRSEKEIKMLAMIDLSEESSVRFMCQCSVTAEEGKIVIEYGV
jgi:ferredoxin